MNIIQSCFVGFFKCKKLSCNKTINFLHEKVLNNFTIKLYEIKISKKNIKLSNFNFFNNNI